LRGEGFKQRWFGVIAPYQRIQLLRLTGLIAPADSNAMEAAAEPRRLRLGRIWKPDGFLLLLAIG